MSYDTLNQSRYSARPVELYKFSKDDENWFYTSHDRDVEYNGNTYISTPLTRGIIENTPDSDKQSLTITMPETLNFLTNFLSGPPTSVITIVVYRGHYSDSEFITSYIGKVVNVSFPSNQSADIKCDSLLTALKRPSVRMKYSKNCPYDLYGQGCNLNKEDFGVDATITVATALQYNSNKFLEKDSGFYTGGMLSYTVGSVTIYRFIVEHTDNMVKLNLSIPGISNNDEVRVYPGCDRTLLTCRAKFENEDNYGGQPFYPDKNPFTGDLIY